MVEEEQDKFAQEVEAGRYQVVRERERLELEQEIEAGRADKVRARLEEEQKAGRRAVSNENVAVDVYGLSGPR